MKIKVKEMSYEEVLSKEKCGHVDPCKQSTFVRHAISLISKKELKDIDFKCEYKSKLDKSQAYLFLMNHSSFTDLHITSTILSNRQYHIVCTNDGFVGKELLMRKIGCIPTKKFITDVSVVRDMRYVVKKQNSSILMYPEASYSFDGTETPLPTSIAKLIKMLKIPVVMIKTSGAFLRDPLYNNLQKRNVKVTATVEEILDVETIEKKSFGEIYSIIAKEFEYNHFKEQIINRTIVDEDFRADGLHRVLYKCPSCEREGVMLGKGIEIACQACGKKYELTKFGQLSAINGITEFETVPDWYKWERESVRYEIMHGKYNMDIDVDILMFVDYKAMYKVGSGRLVHNKDGFALTGCDGKLNFKMQPKQSYSLYSDYYWYEIGDVICLGDSEYQYYCFPKNQQQAIVAKARLATEELYKICE